ncbi:MAG: SPOR domain-containing protein [Pseudomonadales bacterium]
MPDTGTTTRYRVTGALFLLALAAIFGPMLFDGAGLQGPELAPMPQAKPAQPVQAPDGAFDGLEQVAEQAAQLRQVVDEEQFEQPAPAAAIPVGDPADAGVQRPGDPGIAPVSASTAVWAVQVASFSNRENAVALRGQLRQQGYEAFLSDIKLQSKILTRVAVGPYLSETAASRAQRKIAERFDLQAQLVSMVI